MAEGNLIDVEGARRNTQAGALLVCAYNDDAKCQQLKLDGSMSLSAFRARVPSLLKTQHIIFYCA